MYLIKRLVPFAIFLVSGNALAQTFNTTCENQLKGNFKEDGAPKQTLKVSLNDEEFIPCKEVRHPVISDTILCGNRLFQGGRLTGKYNLKGIFDKNNERYYLDEISQTSSKSCKISGIKAEEIMENKSIYKVYGTSNMIRSITTRTESWTNREPSF